jgi:hypothetical protein
MKDLLLAIDLLRVKPRRQKILMPWDRRQRRTGKASIDECLNLRTTARSCDLEAGDTGRCRNSSEIQAAQDSGGR